jgi:hypothetical protein
MEETHERLLTDHIHVKPSPKLVDGNQAKLRASTELTMVCNSVCNSQFCAEAADVADLKAERFQDGLAEEQPPY